MNPLTGKRKQFYRAVVVIWLAFSIGSVVLAAISWWRLSGLMTQGRKLTVVRDDLDGIVKSLLDTETGVRGYVITGNRNYLEPFISGTNHLSEKFDDLIALVGNDPEFLKILSDTRAQSELNINWAQQVIDARAANASSATAMIDAGRGTQIMDDIRAQMGQLAQLRAEKISNVREQIDRQIVRANMATLIAGATGLVAGLIALWLSQVYLRQQRREYELTAAKLEAERSSREKTAFLANMSHEIRTPMNAILGFSELLQKELSDPRHRQYMQSIRSSGASLLLLINDILDMSKIEAGAMELHPEPTDLREVCDFLQTLFSEAATKKGIKLECQIVGNLPHALLMDRIRLRQILINVVGNAVKFTDKGGVEIRVSWERQPTSSRVTLVIEIQDTGVGIPQDKLDAIFKPFVQAGTHREQEKQGTGLGLSIVKRLTEIMGGTVTVASVLGQGSAFHLRFPNVPISARLPASHKLSETEEADFNELHPATLLVVDDNATNRDLIAEMFTNSHHRLFFGANGGEAIDKARELKPDILLLDVRMPGMNGDEALAQIRKVPGLEFLPVIAVTASNLLNQENVLKERFSGYVRKPFSRRELFNELADFLPRHVQPESEKEKDVAANPSAAFPPAPKELISQLRQLVIEPWPAIRDSVAVNESKVFAQGLEGLGQRWQCEPLIHYAQKLLHDAENYAVTDLEKHLGEFALLVEQLDKGGQP